MRPTHNTLSENIRAQSVELLNKHLAAAIDLHAQVEQAHWNVRGPSFIAIHELCDKVSGAVENYSGLIAERAGALRDAAYGTVQVATDRSFLVHYPFGLADEQETRICCFRDARRTRPIRTRGHRSSGNFWRFRYRGFVHRNLARYRPSIMVCRISHRPQEMIAAYGSTPELRERTATAVTESSPEAK